MTRLLTTAWSQALVLLLTLGLASGGLALKHRRYEAPVEQRSADTVLGGITKVAAAHGWEIASLRGDGRETFPWLAFIKPECARPIIVAVVKAGGELDSLARTIYGSEIALFGLDDADASANRFLDPVVRLARHLGATSPGGSRGPTPRLAIHPAPPSSAAETCAGPPLTSWLDGLRPILMSAAAPDPNLH